MMSFGRDKLAAYAQELLDQLQVVENVKAIQAAQKELADAVKTIDDRMRSLEIDMRALKAEVLLQAMRETQSMVNAVQSGLNQRIEDLAVSVALIKHKPVGGLLDANLPNVSSTRRREKRLNKPEIEQLDDLS